MEEIWKDIEWYNKLYKVSNLGRIKSFKWKGGRILKPWKTKVWYNFVVLYIWKKYKYHSVHRLVMENFNWKSILHVNHKNWIKTDNRLNNLEYCTRSENMLHSYKVLNQKKTYAMRWKIWKLNHLSKKVKQLDLQWNLIKYWYSIADIQRELWISNCQVSANCTWKQKTCHWFIFNF